MIAQLSPRAHICENCGRGAKTVTTEPGSRRLEIALWLLFVLPGAFYRLWRSYNGRAVCQACGGDVVLLHDETPRLRPSSLSLEGRAPASVKFTSWTRFGERAAGELVSQPDAATVECGAVVSQTRLGIDIDLVAGATSRQAWFPFGKSTFEYEGVRYDWSIVWKAALHGVRYGGIGAFFFAAMANPATFLIRFRCDTGVLTAETSAKSATEVLRHSLSHQWQDEKALISDLFRSRLTLRVFGGTALALVICIAAGVLFAGLGKHFTSLSHDALNSTAIVGEGLVFVLVLWRIWRHSGSRPKAL